MISALAAILLLGVAGSQAQIDSTCCSPNFRTFSYSPIGGSPHTAVYSNLTYNRYANTTDENGNPVYTLLHPKLKREYVRTVDNCTWTEAPLLEIGEICLRDNAEPQGPVVLEGVTHYHWIQQVGDLTDNVVMTKDCVPKVTHITPPSGPGLFVVFFNIEVLPESSPEPFFDMTDCTKA